MRLCAKKWVSGSGRGIITETIGRKISFFRTVALNSLIGAVLGVLFLHPVTMAIYWFEFHHEHADITSILDFFLYRMYRAFSFRMLLMTFLFAVIGGLLGGTLGIYSAALARRNQLIDRLQMELGRDVDSLIRGGESETVEFKSSARWDYHLSRINSAIEDGILRTIAGFMNHLGGNLLIGVSDTGEIKGLERDYATLKRQNRDGFQQYVMTLIRMRLGGQACPLVHVIFHDIEGQDVCRVFVEPSGEPTYVISKDSTAHYFVRTGNSTRELDIQEALEHIALRKPAR